MITPRDEFKPKELSPLRPTGMRGLWRSTGEIYDHMMIMVLDEAKRRGIGVYDFKSKKITPLTNNLDLSIWHGPIFFLDGQGIVYAHRDNTGRIKIITIDKAGSSLLTLMNAIITEDPRYFWFGMSANMHGTTLVYTVSNKSEALLVEIDLRSGRHATLFKTNEKVGIEPTLIDQDLLLAGFIDPDSVIPEEYTASPALNEPKYNQDGSKISYFRSIMGSSFWNPNLNPEFEYDWKTRQLFVYSKATGKIRQITPDDSVILGSDWYGDELYFIGTIGSQSGLWRADESGQVKQLISFVCDQKPGSVEIPPNEKHIAFFDCHKIYNSVEISPNGKYIAFSASDIESGMVGIAHLK